MKMKVIALVVGLMLVAGQAGAAVLTATLGDRNSSDVYRVQVDSDGTLYFASDTSIVFPYRVKTVTSTTTTDTVSVLDSGKTIAVAGVAGAFFTLPSAVPGLKYTFVSRIAKAFTVDTVSPNIINYSTAVAGQSITSAGAIADSVTLCSVENNKWEVCAMKGTFTVTP